MRPGTLVHVGEVQESATRMTVVNYANEYFEQAEFESIDQILKYKASEAITWVIIEGLTNIDVIEEIGEKFDIHDLVLEDILNTHQRPKFEEHDDHLYIVLKCLFLDEDKFSVSYEQISILLLRNFVFVFKEQTDDFFLPLQQRILNSKGRLRWLGSDYLTYTILDTIVDQNFILIDSLNGAINELEENLLVSVPSQDMLINIQRLKREVIGMRKHISPLRELMTAMLRTESNLIDEKTTIYLRDVSDHVLRVIESVDVCREVLTGLLDIYLSSVSNKMNEVMKVLTVFASIFIPLTFIAGIYGMNFEYMPELKWKWSYPILMFGFVAIPVVLLIYFRKKKWF